MRQIAAALLALAGLSLAAYGQAPVITAVLDAASYTADVAQGSIFVVKGSNLSTVASGYTAATLPLNTTLAGVKITFAPASGGAGTDAFMVYTYNVSGVNQLAALLPSTVAPGSYNVTVTNNGSASAAFKVTVRNRKFGLITADGSGSGLAVIQNFISAAQLDIDRFTTGTISGITASPAHPGQVLIAWGTGIGGISGADNVAPGAVDFRNQVDVKVIVGGEVITPAYAGRAPSLPGADQINFTLPADVATGCTISFQVSVGGQLSNPATVAIAAPGAAACVSPALSSDVLARLDQGGTIVAGGFTMVSLAAKASVPGFGTVTVREEDVSGTFTRYTGAQLATATEFQVAPGSCQTFHRVGSSNDIINGTSGTNLDAGNAITINGPNLANKQLTKRDTNCPPGGSCPAPNSYHLNLGTAVSLPPGVVLPPGLGLNTTPFVVPGTYTLAGTGGADIGAFNASVTVGPTLQLSGDLPANVPRSQNLMISWTGGNSNDLIGLLGYSATLAGGTKDSPILDAGIFVCGTTAGRGSITVPSSVLLQLPATPPDAFSSGTGDALLVLIVTPQPVPGNGVFTAPLTAGGNIDVGTFIGTIGFASQTLFQ